MRKRKIFSITLFAAYAVWCAVMFLCHEPWRDEVQSWLLVRDLDFVTLLSQLRYDGHPAGWFLLLWPLAKLGLPFMAERVLHLVIVLAAAYIVCFKTKSIVFKCFVLAATPMMYELSALSRNYALSALALLILAICHNERFGRRLALYCICLFFLINSNIYGTIAGAALVGTEGLLLIVARFTPEFSPPPLNRQSVRRYAVYFGVAAVSFFCVWIVVFSGVFLPFNPTPLYPNSHFEFIQNYGFGLKRIYEGFFRAGSAAVFGALPAHVSFLSRWQEAAFTLICTLIVLSAVAGAVVTARGAATRLWIAAAGVASFAGTVLAVTVTGIFNIRHVVPFLFVLVYIWHIVFLSEKRKTVFSNTSFLRRAGVLLAGCVFVGAFALNVYRARLDILYPYSMGKDAAVFLRDNGYDSDETLILAADHPFVSTVLGFTRKIKTFRFVYGDYSYVPWQVYLSSYERSFDLSLFAREQLEEYGNEYENILFLGRHGDNPLYEEYPVIYNSGEDNVIMDETYILLRLK